MLCFYKNLRASLTRFYEKNDNKISVRFSTRNLDMNAKILNVPIFIAEYIDKLIQIEEQNNGGRKNF